MRSLRSEIYSLLMVLAVPAGVALVFPYSAFDFHASHLHTERPAFVSFVTLDAASELAAVKAAKTSWRGGDDGVSRMRAELSLGELPESVPTPVMPISSRASVPPPAPLSPKWSMYLPRLAAPAPEVIAPTPPQSPEPTFSRREMLEIK